MNDGSGSRFARGEMARDPAAAETRIRAALWWALLVLPLWIVLTLCAHWEPVMGDGWGHVRWHRANSLGLYAIYDFCRGIYLNENPRLGQLWTLLSYARGPYHTIVMPVVELGVFAMVTVLALGRWPSLWRSADALTAAIAVAIVVACTPQLGPMLFYRPFTGNYACGLALNLLWLVPYRLELEAPRPQRLWLVPAMLVLGLAAGLSNEHTGLAFIAMGAFAAVVALRRRGVRIWMIAGLAGMVAGYWLLLTAPGQSLRYQGLAAKAGILERIAERGVTGNLYVVAILALAMVWALPLVAVGLAERRATGPASLSTTGRWSCAVLALAGVACTLTLLASPKIGPRLFFASVALIAAGLSGWLAAQLRSAWARRTAAILAAGAMIFVAVRLVAIHRIVGPLSATRLSRIERGAPGSVVHVPRYPFAGSRYFLGDDFAAPRRQSVAEEYGLKAIEIEASEPP